MVAMRQLWFFNRTFPWGGQVKTAYQPNTWVRHFEVHTESHLEYERQFLFTMGVPTAIVYEPGEALQRKIRRLQRKQESLTRMMCRVDEYVDCRREKMPLMGLKVPIDLEEAMVRGMTMKVRASIIEDWKATERIVPMPGSVKAFEDECRKYDDTAKVTEDLKRYMVIVECEPGYKIPMQFAGWKTLSPGILLEVRERGIWRDEKRPEIPARPYLKPSRWGIFGRWR